MLAHMAVSLLNNLATYVNHCLYHLLLDISVQLSPTGWFQIKATRISGSALLIAVQGQLNSLKVVGAQLTNKTHFCCEKLNSCEHS